MNFGPFFFFFTLFSFFLLPFVDLLHCLGLLFSLPKLPDPSSRRFFAPHNTLYVEHLASAPQIRTHPLACAPLSHLPTPFAPRNRVSRPQTEHTLPIIQPFGRREDSCYLFASPRAQGVEFNPTKFDMVTLRQCSKENDLYLQTYLHAYDETITSSFM